MKKKQDYYTEIVEILRELKSLYPSYSIGKHISTALDEYNDVWGTSDKEILFAFTKYKAQLELDVPHETSEKELKKIIRDAKNLNIHNLLEDGEENIYNS